MSVKVSFASLPLSCDARRKCTAKDYRMPATFWTDLGQVEFWVAALEIIWINILLSGNNVVLIAMTCRSLPPRQRLLGTFLGVGLAVLLCILFAELVTWLMTLPYLRLGAGIALTYIAVKLLLPEEGNHREIDSTAHLWQVVRVVAVSNVIVSLDNVIATAAAAQGNTALLVIELAISIPATIAGVSLIGRLLDQFPALVWAGSALLGWVAGEVIASDPVIQAYLAAHMNAAEAHNVALSAPPACASLVLGVGGMWRHARHQTAAAEAPSKGRRLSHWSGVR